MIKEENKNGVLILFRLEYEISNRYERYAGVSNEMKRFFKRKIKMPSIEEWLSDEKGNI